jgi:repressor of nif and glnA expression
METCQSCGASIVENAMYCHACGAAVPKHPNRQEFTVSADDLTRKVKELVHEGNVRKIIVKDEHGKELLQIPVTVGVVGIVLAPWLAAVGVIAALVTKCTIVVERRMVPATENRTPAA